MAGRLAGGVLALALLVAAALLASGGDEREAGPGAGRAGTVVWAVGDGADGSADGRRLARYVAARRPDRFIYLGDVYETGAAREFAEHYDPVYGRLAGRTDPVIGNHEYAGRDAGYLPYWRRERGWSSGRALHRSSVDPVSGWQVIAYSSESDPRREGAWVRRQVARHGGTCRIAAGHRGRYVAADTAHGDNRDQAPIWRALAGRTAVNLVGHNHLYARLAPIDGVHVLVSGAGGHELRALGPQRHAVAAIRTGVPTATRLTLRRGALDFRQVDARGRVYDAGTITCTPAAS
jgi:acid phosphatase type 7